MDFLKNDCGYYITLVKPTHRQFIWRSDGQTDRRKLQVFKGGQETKLKTTHKITEHCQQTNKTKQSGQFHSWIGSQLDLERTSFFVPPARHGEAQDVSGT